MTDEVPPASEPVSIPTNIVIEELLRVYGWALRQLFPAFGIEWSKAHLVLDDRTSWSWAQTEDGCIQYAQDETEMNMEGDYFVDTIRGEYRAAAAESNYIVFHVDIEDGDGTEELAVFDLRKKIKPFSICVR